MSNQSPVHVSIKLKNGQARPLTVVLEPWATEYELLPGSAFDIVEVGGDPNEAIELQLGENIATFFARAGARMSVVVGGRELP